MVLWPIIYTRRPSPFNGSWPVSHTRGHSPFNGPQARQSYKKTKPIQWFLARQLHKKTQSTQWSSYVVMGRARRPLTKWNVSSCEADNQHGTLVTQEDTVHSMVLWSVSEEEVNRIIKELLTNKSNYLKFMSTWFLIKCFSIILSPKQIYKYE